MVAVPWAHAAKIKAAIAKMLNSFSLDIALLSSSGMHNCLMRSLQRERYDESQCIESPIGPGFALFLTTGYNYRCRLTKCQTCLDIALNSSYQFAPILPTPRCACASGPIGVVLVGEPVSRRYHTPSLWERSHEVLSISPEPGVDRWVFS